VADHLATLAELAAATTTELAAEVAAEATEADGVDDDQAAELAELAAEEAELLTTGAQVLELEEAAEEDREETAPVAVVLSKSLEYAF